MSRKKPKNAAYGSETFPDLHHKMSKKVAQLTKVIYHLNTRNEDFQADLSSTKSSHASEVEEILQDAADKINAFKTKLAAAKQNGATAAALQKLKKQHRSEKEEALAEFTDYKKTVRDREDKLRKEFGVKVDGLRTTLETTKDKFKTRVKQFRQALEKVQANKGASVDELNALKEAHRIEVDDLVKESNKKYNDMLAQRLDEEDKLRAQLLQEFELKTQQLLKRHTTELSNLKEKMMVEKNQEITTMKKEAEDNMSAMKTKLVTKMETLLSDLESVRKSESNLKIETRTLQERIVELETALNETKEQLTLANAAVTKMKLASGASTKEMEDVLSAREKQMTDLQARCNELEMQLRATKDERDLLAKQIVDYERDIQTQKTLVKDTQQQNTLLNKEIEQLKKQLLMSNSGSDGLNQELNNAKEVIQKLQVENKDLHVALVAASKLKNQNEQEWTVKHKKEVAAHGATKKELLKQQDLNKSMTEGASSSGKDIARLTKEIAQLKLASKAALAQLQQSHDASMKTKEAEWTTKFEALKKDAALTQKNLVEKHKTEMEQLKKTLGSSNKELIQKMNEKHGNELKKALKELKIKLEKEHAIVVKNIQIQIKKELKMSFDKELQASLHQQEVAFKKKLQESTVKTTILCQKKQEQAIKLMGEEHAKIIEALKRQHQEAMDLMRSEIERKIRNEMSSDMSEKMNAMKLLETALKDKHLKEMEDLKQQHVLAMEALRVELTKEMDGTLQKKQVEWERLQQEAVQKARSEEHVKHEQLMTTHKATVAEEKKTLLLDAETKHTLHIKEINDTHAKTMAVKEQETNELLNKKQLEFDQLLIKEKTMVKEELQEKQQQEIKTINNKHMEAMKSIQNKMTNQHATAIKQLNEKNHIRMEQLQQEHANAMNILETDLKEAHKQELGTLTTTHFEETKRLNDEFLTVKSSMEQMHDELMANYQELKQRFLNRESKPEDLERIAMLEQLMVSKDEEIKRVKEEMRYFKLELLNREENFNSKFSRPNQTQLNVGVMQVIKPKNGSNKNKKKGQRSKSIQPGLPSLTGGPGRPTSDSRRVKNNQPPQKAPQTGPPPQRRRRSQRPQ